MAVYKCKMCGGTLEVTDNQSVAECDYCGTKQTLPTAQDETLQKLFNRANILRMKSEFDKAAELYEKLIQMKPDEAEAYWGLILCKYGIEYVEDPKTLSRIPTCHRASFSSVVADEDYKSALSYADTLQKTIYESEAKEIDRLQKEIIDISRNESPYDIFICYKETDSDGKRTQDSVIANEIYHQLTAEGYKVFYAAITLEDKLGSEYEPYIFAALHSAKVMLVVGTKPEYFNAVWVKNEWSRYLHLLKSDRSKLLIPCYRDMDPYELPEEFAHLQAQDMSKIGFINDIVRGIRKIIKKDEAQTAKKEAAVVDSVSQSVQALLERGYMALEDGEWSRADEFFEQVLNTDARNGKAYLGKFLAAEKKPDFDAVINTHIAAIANYSEEQLENEKSYFEKNNHLSRAIQYGSSEISDKFKDFYTKLSERVNEAKQQAEEQYEIDYQNAINCAKTVLKLKITPENNPISYVIKSIREVYHYWFKKEWYDSFLIHTDEVNAFLHCWTTGIFENTQIFKLCQDIQNALDELKKFEGYKKADVYLQKLQSKLSDLEAETAKEWKNKKTLVLIVTLVIVFVLLATLIVNV